MKHSFCCNLKRCDGWVRVLYMVIAVACYSIAKILVAMIALFQTILFLFTRKVNDNLRVFSQSLATYIYQIIRFLTFNSELRPFPFAEWPDGVPDTNEETAIEYSSCDGECSCFCHDDKDDDIAAETPVTHESAKPDTASDAQAASKTQTREATPSAGTDTASSMTPEDNKDKKDTPAS